MRYWKSIESVLEFDGIERRLLLEMQIVNGKLSRVIDRMLWRSSHMFLWKALPEHAIADDTVLILLVSPTANDAKCISMNDVAIRVTEVDAIGFRTWSQ